MSTHASNWTEFRKAYIPSAADSEIGTSSIALNNAGLGLMSAPCSQKAQDLFKEMHEGMMGNVPELFEQYQNSREIFARFIGCSTDELAFTHTCAIAISQLAFGLDIKEEEEILGLDCEYPSNAYPWIEAARRKGAHYRQLTAPQKSEELTKLLDKEVGEKTRVVALSWVQYQTGLTADLREIARICHSKNCLLIVDGIQGLGVMDFDFAKSGVDAVCGGTHKWMGGPFGLGFFAARKEIFEGLQPIYVGAMTYTSLDELAVDLERKAHKDFTRFEPGAPHLLLSVPAAESLKVIEAAGVKQVQARSLELAKRLREGVLERGFELLNEFKSPSPISSFAYSGDSQRTQQLFERLSAEGFLLSLRGKGIRVAPHAFNTEDEIDSLLAALSS